MEEDKKLDDFIRKSIKDIGLESPSVDFSDLIQAKILTNTNLSPHLTYKPLLPKTVWVFVVLFVAVIFAHAVFGQPELQTTWFSMAQLNKLASFNILGKIPIIPISSTLVYGILTFTIFVWVQILIIKKRVDKHYNFN